jgi:FKBP-type peptidyl-prolyl cis-trans isomerase
MTLRAGIKLLEEIEGIGQAAQKGDTVEVKMNGWLNKGQHIQKDYVGTITLGSRIAIPGIEYAIMGMKRGGRRRIKISPHLGYGENGVKGLIPSNAVLIYEIELINVA